MLYSPLTYQVMQDEAGAPLIDFGAEVPRALDRQLDRHRQDHQGAAAGAAEGAQRASTAALAFLRAPQNRAAAVKLIAEIDEIAEPVAAAELDGNIMKLSTDGEFSKEWMERALDMARLIGMTDLAPVEDIYITHVQAGADQ